MPSWDNTARRGRQGRVFLNSDPSAFALWLRKVVLQTLIRAEVQEPLVFVNAWNEWAEGTHLEPDDRYGRAWLEAILDGLRDGIRQFRAYGGTRVTPGDALNFAVEAPLRPTIGTESSTMPFSQTGVPGTRGTTTNRPPGSIVTRTR